MKNVVFFIGSLLLYNRGKKLDLGFNMGQDFFIYPAACSGEVHLHIRFDYFLKKITIFLLKSDSGLTMSAFIKPEKNIK